MSTTLKALLRTQAAAYSPLVSYLGSSPFRWWDGGLQQGSAFPAIAVQQISNPQMSALTGRLATSIARIQFTIWDVDPEDATLLEQVLYQFLDQFNAVGPSNLPAYPVEISGGPASRFADQDPVLYTRISDAMIFWNQTL
jgi:hypothetical protein